MKKLWFQSHSFCKGNKKIELYRHKKGHNTDFLFNFASYYKNDLPMIDKKRLSVCLVLLFSLLVCMPSYAQRKGDKADVPAPRLYGDMLTVRNTRPGGLKQLLNADIRKRVRRLTIEGAINKEDASVLRSIGNRSTCYNDRAKIIDNYLDLDLSRAYLESSFINGQDVTYTDMFRNASHIRSVRLPRRLNGIGPGTFYGNDRLEDVEMPRSVRFIDREAFKGCKKLRGIRLPEGLEEIGREAFSDCTGLEYIQLPSTVAVIGDQAFYNCPLTELELPIGLQTLGKSCISGTKVRQLHIPRDTHIEGGMPGNSPRLEHITVENGNNEYSSHDGVLYDRDLTVLLEMPIGRQGVYTIPNGVTEINAYAFQGSQLTRVNIPASLSIIGEGAFCNCSNIESIYIPERVSEIPAHTFSDCGNLRHIDLPNGLLSIGSRAFNKCMLLENLQLPSSLRTLGKGSFYSCQSIQRLTIPEGVTVIPDQCFFNCKKMTTVRFPSRLTEICEEGFRGCDMLSSLMLPNSLMTIGNEAFRACLSLREVTIPSSVKKIGKKPFIKCGQLQRIICQSPNPPELKHYSNEKVTLMVPRGSGNLYKKAKQWKKYKTIEEY